MQIGFVDIMDKSSGGNGPNVALAALSGYLTANGHEVGVLDVFHADREEQSRFFGLAWGLVGISASSFDFEVGLRAAAEVKKRTGAPVVFGGPHASVAREEILAQPEVDYAIYGEGEVPLLGLAELLAKDRHPQAARLKEINGLIFRDGQDVSVNPPQSRVAELDTLPLPAYRLFPMEKYSEHHISTSRGCPFSCVFCASGAILGKRWIGRSPERIVEEIECLIRDFGKKTVVIVDDTFNLDIERVKRFCRILLERRLGISWLLMAGLRADRMDLEMLQLMKASGCRDFGIGIESADPGVLKRIGKGETIEDITRGIALIKRAGFRVFGSFMIGNPGDTLETVKRSFEFAAQALDGTFVYHAMPFPNTKLWAFVEQHGHFLRSDYTNFDKHSAEPMFETPEFPRSDRVAAYRAAQETFPDAGLSRSHRLPITRNGRAFVRRVRDEGVWSAVQRTGSFLMERLKSAATSRIDTRVPPAD